MSNDTPKTLGQDTLKQVFVHNLNRIYFGKCYLDAHLDHLKSLVSFNALQQALQEFWDDVKKQIVRMEQVYKLIGETPSDKNCNPIKSIVKDEFCLDEGQSIPVLLDMDIMMYLQLLEHINITSCHMLIMVAEQLNYTTAKQLLTECKDESIDNDELFTLIIKEYISVN
ncbi:ferritin-like metal-binding protein YciE [Mucilaginibacter oryzae]|uniref:Ferritin-like metal-binding protein YciE n=1 Tax=Mucilaginibacter oryzae TaxID=468058 RepID=A0A316HHK9_9SPHI|nr:DUF892 family protein [Mucilaginibacter oryzae]PWK80118.1 ferritin-like metal-binding protein YciE [Mucilaginibacter oryzae]